MHIVKHITFFYSENTKNRTTYINRIISEVNKYEHDTDIFIHTNYLFSYKVLHFNETGNLKIIVHDLLKEDPQYLAWKCRDLLKSQRNDYDIFIYIEDDILIPKDAIQYWLENKDILIPNNYNLGFLRIEYDENKNEYVTDFADYIKPLDSIININDNKYILNNNNPYCAMWIYDKNEFSKFVDSEFYNMNNIKGYGIREQSAIGLHGLETSWYKGTLIPIVYNYIDSRCKIYHLPNNYVNYIERRILYNKLCMI